jgi:hypothetical protein
MSSRYKTIPIKIVDNTREKTKSQKTILSTNIYPEIPNSGNDIIILTTSGTRLDNLANRYYNNSTLWWIISIANPSLPQDSIYPPSGIELRIPSNPQDVIDRYREFN